MQDELLTYIKIFSRAYTLLNNISVNAEENLRKGLEYDKIDFFQSIPAVILLAFTVELSIKALIFKDTNLKAKKLHDLGRLFNDLKEHRRKRMINYVCKNNMLDENGFYEHLKVSEGCKIN